MATSKKVRKLARERQARTGEPYTIALTHVRKESPVGKSKFELAVQEAKVEFEREWGDACGREELTMEVASLLNDKILPVLLALPMVDPGDPTSSRAVRGVSVGPEIDLNFVTNPQRERKLTGRTVLYFEAFTFPIVDNKVDVGWLDKMNMSTVKHIRYKLVEYLSPTADEAAQTDG